MAISQADFVIAASFRLPGLGILVLPVVPAPFWLSEYALHTALEVTLLVENLSPNTFIGTVEELTHDDQPTQRALLLEFSLNSALLPGTRLKLATVYLL